MDESQGFHPLEAQELPGFGFTEETAEKRTASFGSDVVGATAMMLDS